MRKIIYQKQQQSQQGISNKDTRSISSMHSRGITHSNYILTSRQTQPKFQIKKLQLLPKPEVPSLKIIKNQTHSQFKQDNISIQDGYSPGIYSQRTSSQYQQNLNSYMSSKRSIYKSQQIQNYESQVQIYNTALNQMIYRNDQKELMDFDNRYYRCARQRRLREIIQFLLKKSKELQISLQDLIDNKITQNKPYQQQGSFAFLFYVKKGVTDKVEEMLGVNPLYVHDFDEKNMTALHIATKKQSFIMIKILLSYGASILSKDLNRETALSIAIQSNQQDVVKLFLSVQCPNDLEYLNYTRITKNKQIKYLLKKAKLQDLGNRCSKLNQFDMFNHNFQQSY
ncbi:unnamed protein product [Paramecium sonneborni]|uniref:Uncharacterized protein n=1 Tax=Paramecium sonneborni TaxID=65129 RepID=A0A8S1LQE8_9CILI|nr:unnamed protein product [Paramecium sonneborni]